MVRVAISVGDLNGVGIEICLKSHNEISKLCEPIYCINNEMLLSATKKLDIQNIELKTAKVNGSFKIKPAKISKKSGLYSFNSFKKAINLCETNQVDAIITMPINKQSWNKAGITHRGHTEYLREHFKKDAIMMLGNNYFFVSLFTDHIPLNEVCSKINTKDIKRFLLEFYQDDMKKVGVLGVNPHSGDGGVLGSEDIFIENAIHQANKELNMEVFEGPLVPDIAFTKNKRERYKYFVAMYHDQGLAPLKTMDFENCINISLNLPIRRVSVGHGSAFDIAYKKNSQLSTKSYINAIKYAIKDIKMEKEWK